MLAGLVGEPQSATLAKLQMYEMRLNRELRACMNEFRKEYQSRTHADCHKAYCEGYNRGVRDQAESTYREPAIQPMEPPEPSLEAADEEPDEPTDASATAAEQTQPEPAAIACHIGGDLTEQSQFVSNERPEQELAMSGDVAADAEASLAALPTRSRHAEGAAA